ncbi:MAG: lamin tail domain-containing protein, partial [Candidatus Marinimicrobia bacterium]|nr:lamin tail domain-containing protein [Candidatus Neomarinimicrobiota bacterium]
MAQIFFSEVMFDLEGSDSPNEFIELFNASNEDFEIESLKIADKFSIDDLSTDAINPIIKPQSYALIMEGDYNGFYDEVIPEDVIILHVDDSSIGNGLSKTDSLFLIQTDDTLAILGWSRDNHPTGFSLERISFNNEFDEAWSTSIDSLGTPGKLNGVHSQTIDAAIDSIAHSPEFPEPFQTISLRIYLSNQGISPATGILNIDNFYSEEIELDAQSTKLIEFEIDGYDSGINHQQFYISNELDYNNMNDSLWHEIRIPFEHKSLIINEIMYDPLTDESEWIELYNPTAQSISLWGWTISDAENFQKDDSIDEVIILSDSYIIFSKQETGYHTYAHFPTLNNSGDNIYLFDPTGNVINHVDYESSWGGGDGYSLERISPNLSANINSNWGTSINELGSTPNTINSLFASVESSNSKVTITPVPFTPNGDGIGDICTILYNLPFSQGYLDAIIFDVKGRQVSELSINKSVAKTGLLIW